MRTPPDPRTTPAHPDFDALVTAKHLAYAIEVHSTPQGLIAYWNQEKNRKRLTEPRMPEKWKLELEKRFQAKLEALNDAGPY